MKLDNVKDKLMSGVVWTTLIPIIANLVAVLVSQNYADQFSSVATTIVTLLAVIGILNNPNDKESFLDNIKKKLSSKVVWVTAIPLIANLIATFASQTYADKFSVIATTITSALAVIGILNNPTTNEAF